MWQFPALQTHMYWGTYEQTSLDSQLNTFERLWVAWYAYMQNDVLATGIMSFAVHELVFWGRSLPWMIVGRIPFFQRYKIQNVSCLPNGSRQLSGSFGMPAIPSHEKQWKCIRLVFSESLHRRAAPNLVRAEKPPAF
jgi:hypothetical protein